MKTGYRRFSGKAKKCIGCKNIYIRYNKTTHKKEVHCKLEDIDKISQCLNGIRNYHVPDPYLAASHPRAYPVKWSE